MEKEQLPEENENQDKEQAEAEAEVEEEEGGILSNLIPTNQQREVDNQQAINDTVNASNEYINALKTIQKFKDKSQVKTYTEEETSNIPISVND